MLYLQIYFLIGVIYTYFVYDDFYRGVLKRAIEDNYVLYCANKKEFVTAIRIVCLLLIFVWPIHLFGTIYKGLNK